MYNAGEQIIRRFILNLLLQQAYSFYFHTGILNYLKLVPQGCAVTEYTS